MTRYNVTWRHYKYEACDIKVTNNRSYESSFVPAPNKRIVIDNKLLSYSMYELWVGAETLDDYYKVKDAFKVFSTGQSPPDIRTGSSEILETERYGQALNFHWRKPDCRDLNGPHQDYVVELEGLDPWDKGAKELVDNTPVFESFYVQGLMPFTSYLLRVFTRNKGGFQSLVSLDIKARTLETVPEPPTNIHLKAISPTSVHMQWSPAWPPTGEVKMFKISFRQQDKYWSQPTEVDLSHRGACVKAREQRAVTKQGEEFCYVFNNLSEDTKYGFRIKTYNQGVEDSSDWSEVVNVTTPPPFVVEVTTAAPEIINEPPATDIVITSSVSPGQGDPEAEAPTTPGVTIINNSSLKPETPRTTEMPRPVPEPDTAMSQSETTTRNLVIIVIGLLCGIIFLGVLITAVVYKMKIVRLKRQMRSEELWNHGRDPDNLSHSVSYIGGSSVNTRLSDVSAYATISDVSFSLNNSFSNRADPRIQSRRLPELPPAVKNRAESLAEPQYSDAYELEPLPGGGYLDMSRSPSRSSRRHSRVADASVIQVCTKSEYLKIKRKYELFNFLLMTTDVTIRK